MASPKAPFSPASNGVEQILATVDDANLIIKATKDGKLEVGGRCFEETVKILEGERLEIRNHHGQVCLLRRKA